MRAARESDPIQTSLGPDRHSVRGVSYFSGLRPKRAVNPSRASVPRTTQGRPDNARRTEHVSHGALSNAGRTCGPAPDPLSIS